MSWAPVNWIPMSWAPVNWIPMNDPVNQMASYHIDLSSSNFGIQEENHFTQQEQDAFPGTPTIKRGFLYPSTQPGLGVDIDETLARLRKHGAELVSSEVVQYEDAYRLCYIRGPEGLLIGLAEELG